MDDLFAKPRHLRLSIPGWAGFMFDVLAWQVKKQKIAQGEKEPSKEAVLESLLIGYFTEKKQAILGLLNDEVERELLSAYDGSVPPPAGLLRFAGRLRTSLTRACPDRIRARGAPSRAHTPSHARRASRGSNRAGVAVPGTAGRKQ